MLDAGCSTGEIMNFIHNYKKSRVYGVDISKKAISIAKKQYPKYNFKVGSVDLLPFEDNYFNYIVCYDILEHVDDPKKVLDEFQRCLKPEGILIIEYETCDRYGKIVTQLDKKNLTKSSWIHGKTFLKEFERRFSVKKNMWGGQIIAFDISLKIIDPLLRFSITRAIYASIELFLSFIIGKKVKGTWYFVAAKKEGLNK